MEKLLSFIHFIFNDIKENLEFHHSKYMMLVNYLVCEFYQQLDHYNKNFFEGLNLKFLNKVVSCCIRNVFINLIDRTVKMTMVLAQMIWDCYCFNQFLSISHHYYIQYLLYLIVVFKPDNFQNINQEFLQNKSFDMLDPYNNK